MMIETKTKLSLAVLLAFAALMAFAIVTRAQTLINVAPLQAGDDLFDSGKADIVFAGKHFLSVNERLILGANFSDLFRRQDSIANDGSPLRVHISNVIFRRSDEQVSRIAARRIVAAMTNEHSGGDFADCQDHCKNVSAFSKLFAKRENAVAIGITVALPSPAIAGSVNVRPKTISDILRVSFIGASSTTVFNTSRLDGRSIRLESLIAGKTGGRNSLGHFKSPKFDLVKGARALPRSSAKFKTRQFYHKNTPYVSDLIAQTCTPPRFQGWINSCQGLSIRWLNQNPVSDIDRYEVRWHSDNRIDHAAGSAISLSRLSGCGFSSHVTITQFMKNGGSCATTSSGSAPHSFPCSMCGGNGGGNGVSIVSSANFRGAVSRDSLVSAFPDPGVTFTDQVLFASSLPLPTQLGGVSIEIDGQLCGIVAVSPGQINFHLPKNLPDTITEIQATINTTRGSVARFFGRPQINPNAPGIFTASSNGTGAAASVWLVVKPNGQQFYYAPGQLQFGQSDTIVLLLYGTGINDNQCDLILSNGQSLRANYCGASWMQGVQQMNFILSPSQIWNGQISGFVRISRSNFGFWDSQGFDLRR